MVLKLYGAATTTTASVATIDVPQNQRLLGVLVCGSIVAAASAVMHWGLSFASTDQSQSNDTRSEIVGTTLVAGTHGTANFFMPLDEQVFAGERLHLHARVDSGTVTSSNIRLFLITDASQAIRTNRR